MVAALMILAAAATGPALEIEIAGGIAHSIEPGYGTSYPFAVPAVQGRVAIDFPSGVAVGGMFLAVVGGEAPNRAGSSISVVHDQAFSATAALLTVQIDDSFEHPPRRGHAGPAFRLAGGIRYFVADQLALGGELAWMHWTNVEWAAGDTNRNDPAQFGQSTSALLLLFSVGFSIGR